MLSLTLTCRKAILTSVWRWKSVHVRVLHNDGHTPDRRNVVGVCECALQLSLGQEHVEVSVLHVLRHHAERVWAHTHAQQLNDVRVIQTRHDLYLLQEVISTQIIVQSYHGIRWKVKDKHPSLNINVKIILNSENDCILKQF